MSAPIPPLSKDLRALLDAEPPLPAPPGARERVRARLDATLAAPISVAAQPLGPVAYWGAKSLVLLASGIFLAGGIFGAVAQRLIADDRPTLAEVAQPPVMAEAPPAPPLAEPAPPTAETTMPAPEPVVAPPTTQPIRTRRTQTTPAAATPATPPPTATADGRLAEERAAIEMARTALLRGELAAARRHLEAHAQNHGDGRLAEEREALAIEVLTNLGEHDEAHARAMAFESRYPKSLLLPVVRHALEGRHTPPGVP
jgi:hypothetical protein